MMSSLNLSSDKSPQKEVKFKQPYSVTHKEQKKLNESIESNHDVSIETSFNLSKSPIKLPKK